MKQILNQSFDEERSLYNLTFSIYEKFTYKKLISGYKRCILAQ